jgi:hypothetical protein
MKQVVNHTIIFFSFLTAQLLVSSFIDFGPLVFIVLYPLFILTLPVGMSPAYVMLWAFAMGVGTDLLYNGAAGINSASAVMMAFLRQPVQVLIIRKGELDSQIRPGMSELGFRRFIVYAVVCLSIHHFSYIFAESFSFVYFSGNIPRLLVSMAVNITLLLLIEFGVFYKNWK